MMTYCQTIIMSSTMAKFFSTLLEIALSTWIGKTQKRAKGQASFQTQCISVDHFITFWVLMDEGGQSLYVFFMNFEKVFDMVPRDALWERMQKARAPLRALHGSL